ncbi:hypothetical protein [Pseudomonas sp. W2-17]|uniref:hypothetical protein n=1 Tax=Pseudomonas sp. W2-17 TaxID=3058039 RepID=UPI0034E07D39
MTAIKERPILFSAPMVRAILEGRKTVTRREVKKQAALNCLAAGFEPAFLALAGNADLCPYGQPGNRLWVRETWAQPAHLDPGPTVYRATYPDCIKGQGWENLPPSDAIHWKPSIHMFRRDSRILLEITDVRVERLQDITNAESIAEGAEPVTLAEARSLDLLTYQAGFARLWNSINGPGAWAADPWVWVVEFKRVTP